MASASSNFGGLPIGRERRYSAETAIAEKRLRVERPLPQPSITKQPPLLRKASKSFTMSTWAQNAYRIESNGYKKPPLISHVDEWVVTYPQGVSLRTTPVYEDRAVGSPYYFNPVVFRAHFALYATGIGPKQGTVLSSIRQAVIGKDGCYYVKVQTSGSIFM